MTPAIFTSGPSLASQSFTGLARPHAPTVPLIKSLGGANGRTRERPAYIKHTTSETVRRYAALANNIRLDQTPHIDAYLLRSFARRNVVLQAVIGTIIDQVASKFVRPSGAKGVGIKVKQKDTDKQLTRAAATEAKRLEELLLNGGIRYPHPVNGEPGVWDGHSVDGEYNPADELQTAVRLLMRDSLEIDRAAIVIEGSRSGQHPVCFWKHLDGALVAPVDTPRYQPSIRNGQQGSDDLTGKVKYVQMTPEMDFRVDREFGWQECILRHRNPKTDLLAAGFPMAEVEMCLSALTGILYTMQANQDWFTRNHVPQGLITVFGNFDRGDLEDVRGQLAGEVGVGGSIWDVPLLAAAPMQGNAVSYTPFVDRTNMSMVSETYLNLCVALVSAIFKMAPEEFGFSSFGGPKSQIGGDGNTQEKIDAASKNGQLPKILWLCQFFSSLIELENPDFELEIQGLKAIFNPEMLEAAKLDLAELANGKTLNQLRAEQDLPPVVDPIDEELWEELYDKHAKAFFATERERIEACVKEYKDQGGKLGNYPNAPAGNPGMNQIWLQEHMQEAQQTQEQMAGQAGQEQDFQNQQKAAEAQGAQQGLQAQAQREQEFSFGERQADSDAQRNNELRIPANQNPAFGKSLAAVEEILALRSQVQVRRISIRDA